MDNNQELYYFCENVRLLRKFHKLSKRKMAQLMGIHVKTLTKIEMGILPPRLGTSVVYHLSANFCLCPARLFSSLIIEQELHNKI